MFLKKQLEESLANAPFGKLQMTSSHGYPQFYRAWDPAESGKTIKNRRREYLSTKESETIKLLAQKNYDCTMLDLVLQQIGLLENFLTSYNAADLWNIQKKFPKSIQKLITPLYESDEEYIKNWLEFWPITPNSYPFKADILTVKGEHVRSKTEKIIADSLSFKQVPYKYECGIFLQKSNKIKYPDFTCLKVSERRQVFWEHLGMIDSQQYALNNWNRVFDYQTEGFVIGRDYILTYETYDHPLETRMIETLVNEYFL